MQSNTERTEKVLFFHRHILPLLNKSARDFWTQVQHERAKDPQKYPFAVDCVNVLRACVVADLSEYEAKLISQTAGLLVELLWEISEERYK